MANDLEQGADRATVAVPQMGRLVETGSGEEPYRLVAGDGTPVQAVSAWLADLQAVAARWPRCAPMGWTCCGGSGSCGRSRSLGTGRRGLRHGTSPAGCRLRASPSRPHWRRPWRPGRRRGRTLAYSARCGPTARPCLRSFLRVPCRGGQRAAVNPFPLDRSRRAGGPTPTTTRWSRIATSASGLYRPRVRQRSAPFGPRR